MTRLRAAELVHEAAAGTFSSVGSRASALGVLLLSGEAVGQGVGGFGVDLVEIRW